MSQFLTFATILFSFLSQPNLVHGQDAGYAKSPPTTVLRVRVTNVPQLVGTVRVAIYDSEGSWLETPSFTSVLQAEDNSSEHEFTDLPEGEYAIAVYHDKNDNEKLDRNIIGIPREAYGFSNNVKPAFGPCTWDDARISLEVEGLQLVIEL